MIKVKKDKTLVLGLSEENIKRLQQNQPIRFNLNVLLPDQDYTVFIIAGKTENSMALMVKQLCEPQN